MAQTNDMVPFLENCNLFAKYPPQPCGAERAYLLVAQHFNYFK